MSKKKMFFLFIFSFMKIFSQNIPNMVLDTNYSPVTVYNNFQSAGKFSVGVNSNGVNGDVYIYSILGLRKVLPNGLNDNSFGNLGFVTNVIQYTSDSSRIFIKNQKIYLSNNTQIARYDLNGNLDTSFGVMGKITMVGANISFFTINNDESLYVKDNGTIKKITSLGLIDPTFAQILSVDVFLVTSNNELFVKKTTSSDSFFKYTSTGALDGNFGSSGELNVGLPAVGNSTWIWVDFKLTPTEEILVSLYRLSGYYNIIYNTRKFSSLNGIMDASFGINGVVDKNISGSRYNSNNKMSSSIFDSNNNMLVTESDGRLCRYTPNGTPDNTFHSESSCVYIPGIANLYGYNDLAGIYLVNDDKVLILKSIRLSLNLTDHIMDQYIKVMGSLATSEINMEKDINFINPFSNELNIHSNEKIKLIEIYDQSGRLLIKETTKNIVDTSFLEKGIYNIKITTGSNKIILKKAIKK